MTDLVPSQSDAFRPASPVSFGGDGLLGVSADEEVPDDARILYCCHCLDLLEHLPVKRRSLIVRWTIRKQEIDRDDAVRTEPWVDTLHVDQTADQQSGANEEHNGERKFTCDETTARQARGPACGRASAALVQRRPQPELQRRQCRHEANKDSGKNRQ